MEPPLTKYVISLLLFGSVHLQPYLQVVSLSLVGSTKSMNTCFWLTISDGTNVHQMLLPVAFKPFLSDGGLQEGSIIKLIKCIYNIVHNTTYILFPFCLISFFLPNIYSRFFSHLLTLYSYFLLLILFCLFFSRNISVLELELIHNKVSLIGSPFPLLLPPGLGLLPASSTS